MSKGYPGDYELGKHVQRLVGIVRVLRHRGYLSRELADKFNVTVKTIRRDMLHLELAGIPVIVEPSAPNKHINVYMIDPEWYRRF